MKKWYKNQIIKMLEKTENENILRRIYLILIVITRD